MLKKLRALWKRFKRIFHKSGNKGVLAEYDGARCKIYLIDGVRLVGTVRLVEDHAWIQVNGTPRSCMLRVKQIASIVRIGG